MAPVSVTALVKRSCAWSLVPPVPVTEIVFANVPATVKRIFPEPDAPVEVIATGPEPSAPVAATSTRPASIETPPVNVFAPLKTSVPAPVLRIEPLPVIASEMVCEAPDATSTSYTPVISSAPALPASNTAAQIVHIFIANCSFFES